MNFPSNKDKRISSRHKLLVLFKNFIIKLSCSSSNCDRNISPVSSPSYSSSSSSSSIFFSLSLFLFIGQSLNLFKIISKIFLFFIMNKLFENEIFSNFNLYSSSLDIFILLFNNFAINSGYSFKIFNLFFKNVNSSLIISSL